MDPRVDSDLRLVAAEELALHQSEEDCWIVLHGRVYDVTKFLAEHPGGTKAILQEAGRDGTPAFARVHPVSLLTKRLPENVPCIGVFEDKAVAMDRDGISSRREGTPGPAQLLTQRLPAVPSLEEMFNLNDFEFAAEQLMGRTGYRYYASAACDEVTKRENAAAFSRVWLRQRVLMDVHDIDMSCTMLGTKFTVPIFISPCAMAGFAHEDAELGLARAAACHGVLQIISHNATRDIEEIGASCNPGPTQWYQLYVNPNRQKVVDLMQRIHSAGCKALCLTVDTAVLGRRERDMRAAMVGSSGAFSKNNPSVGASQGVGAALGTFSDPRLSWSDLKWLKSLTDLPLVLKGVQRGEDAVMAARHGVAAIIVSNHGGRQLDHVPPALEALVEVITALDAAGLRGRMEVYMDGGVRRGTDVYKALALGANAVGIGRPAMYALTYGQAGVEKALEMIKAELKMTMQLMGVRNLSEIQRSDVVFKPASAMALSDGWPTPSRL